MKKRYVQVGLGGRSMMFSQAVVETYAAHCEMVGFCDLNPGRLERRVAWAKEKGVDAPGYLAADFDRMIAERRPDVVIVTTKDSLHDEYLCRAMELGCDCITEKPMTIDEERCQRIVETARRTGRRCVVTFNYRYSPPRTQVKDLLMSGVIGEVLSVDFQWLLNTDHGADYFRRWHRNKANSGGLLVHKATHHFDLVNWWLSAVPATVYATGARRFYLPQTAARYGLHNRSERCLDCAESQRCPFFLDLKGKPGLRKLYLEHEHHDGYLRDRCVFSEQIDIEDTMSLVVQYANGVPLSYALNAFTPWEGYTVAFNGSRGRLEHKCMETVYISGDGRVPGELVNEGTSIKIYPHFKPGYAVEVWKAQGGHGGGDSLLLADLLAPEPPQDRYLRAADHRAGAWSILVGVAANRSIRTGQPVQIRSLVSGLEEPPYPAMPSAQDPLGPLPAQEPRQKAS